MKLNALDIGIMAGIAYFLFKEGKSNVDSLYTGITVVGAKMGDLNAGPAGLRANLILTVRNDTNIPIPLDRVFGDIIYKDVVPSGTGLPSGAGTKDLKIGSVQLVTPVTVRSKSDTAVSIRVDIPTFQLGGQIMQVLNNGIWGDRIRFVGKVEYGNVSIPVNTEVYAI